LYASQEVGKLVAPSGLCDRAAFLWGASPSVLAGAIFPGMRALKKKVTGEKLRSWRASLLRSRAIPPGIIHAPD
jgi:hypothetical protein